MNNLNTTDSLADEALDEFYQSMKAPQQQYGKKHQQGKKKTMRLTPLAQSSSSHSLSRPQREKEKENGPILLPKGNLAPLPQKSISYDSPPRQINPLDMHYHSHMKHKAAGLSGISPVKGTFVSPNNKIQQAQKFSIDEDDNFTEDGDNLSPPLLNEKVQIHIQKKENLNKKVEEVQYQMLQESNLLSHLMTSVVVQYEQLKDIVDNSLIHRKEIGMKVNEINETYVKLFEEMLQEIMKIQRLKFKSQTKLVEQYREENERVTQTLTIILQEKELLQNDYNKLMKEKEDYEIYNIKLLQENKEINMKCQTLELNNNYLTIENQRIHKMQEEIALNYSLKQTIRNLETTIQDRDTSIRSLTKNMENLKENYSSQIKELNEKVSYLTEINAKNSIFNNLENISFQYPKVSIETQTEINEYGFWDSNNGWTLPISKTALARLRWRKSFAYAKCPSCRGNPSYILQVNSLLKKCYYGITSNSISEMLLGEEKITMLSVDRFIKWRIPDDLVIFLNNLPITVQALKPKSYLWLIPRIHLLFTLKFYAEEEDRYLHYLIQSFLEFCIENFLRNSDNRLLAEIEFYSFYITFKEYVHSSPYCLLIARFLSFLDGITVKERENYDNELKLNELAYQRKKEKEFANLPFRERNKILQERKEKQAKELHSAQQNKGIKNQQELNQFQSNASKNNASVASSEERILTDYSLSKDILKVVLFARFCCLREPYCGVYSKQLTEISKFIHSFKNKNKQQQQHHHQDNNHDHYDHLPVNIKRYLAFEHAYENARNEFWPNTIQSVNPLNSTVYEATTTTMNLTSNLKTPSSHVHNAPQQKKKNPKKPTMTTPLLSLSDPFALPKHQFYDVSNATGNNSSVNNCRYQSYLPLDRLIRVLQPFLAELKPEEIISIYRLIESHTVCISSDGSLSKVEGLNTFIRRTMRLFIYSFPDHGEDISTWEDIKENYHHPSDDQVYALIQEFSAEPTSFGIPAGTGGGNNHNKNDKNNPSVAGPSAVGAGVMPVEASVDRIVIDEDVHNYILMTNFEIFLTIIADIVRNQLVRIEEKLRIIFEQGDTNHDNVLSFDEFKAIVLHVKPKFPDRTILKMFREALLQSPDNKECIGPDAFINICKEFHLFDIISLDELKENQLKALWIGLKEGNTADPDEDEEEEEEEKEEEKEEEEDEESAPFPVKKIQSKSTESVSVPSSQPQPPVAQLKVDIPKKATGPGATSSKSSQPSTKEKKSAGAPAPAKKRAPPQQVRKKEDLIVEEDEPVPINAPPQPEAIPTVAPAPQPLAMPNPFVVSAARLNEPLSKESSNKMMAELAERKQRRMKEMANKVQFDD